MKRKLIASFIFDLGKSESFVYSPTICIYWNVNESEEDNNDVVLTVKYGWMDFSKTYTYYQLKNYLRKNNFIDLAKHEIQERIVQYKGDFEIDIKNEFYLSPFGRFLIKSKEREEIENYLTPHL